MDLVAALRLQLEWGADEALDEAPVDRALSPAGTASARAAASQGVPAGQPRAAPGAPPPERAAGIAAAEAGSIEALRDGLAGLSDCPLRATASHLVFPEAPPANGIVLIGDAPDADEDRAGRALAGPNGAYLARMLASIGIDAAQCAAAQLVPWRPPGGRPATESEIGQCLPFLLRYLALVGPRCVVLLGMQATRILTGRGGGISRLRARWTEIALSEAGMVVPALPVAAPELARLKATARKAAWADMIALRRGLDRIDHDGESQ